MSAPEVSMPSVKIAIICLFAIFPSSAFNQKVIYPEQNSFQGRFINYRITDPVADISTLCIYFDRKGFMWSGTMNGLFRFDGIDYRSYLFNDPSGSGLAGIEVTDICEDSGGKIWIGTIGALNCLDQKSGIIHHFSPDTSDLLSIDNRILKIHEDNQGILWLITGGNIFTFNKITENFIKYPVDSTSFRTATFLMRRAGQILEDSYGRIWIASPDGLYHYSRQEDKFKVFRNIPGNKSSLSANTVTSLSEDGYGTIWCSTLGGGLNKIVDPVRGIFEKADLKVSQGYSSRYDSILTILQDKKGQIWTSGFGTISCYNPDNKMTRNYFLPDARQLKISRYSDALSLDYAFEDWDGDIWFVNSLKGIVFRLNPGSEKLLLYIVPNWVLFDCLYDKTGSFWFGCANMNVQRLVLNSLPYQSVTVNNMFSVTMPWGSRILEDDEKRVWFRFSTGIYRADSINIRSAFNIRQFSFPDGDKSVTSICKDRNGDLWFGRNNGNVTRLAETGLRYTSYLLPDNNKEPIRNIIEDDHGNKWFISAHSLFILHSGRNEIEIFKINDEKLNKSLSEGVFDVLIDSHYRIWFATFGNGLFVYDLTNNDIIHYSSSEGLSIPYGDYCLKIEEDSKGRIWVLYLLNGLYLFDPQTERFMKRGIMDFAERESGFMGLFIDRNDFIWVSHNYGFTIFNPDSGSVRQISEYQASGNCAFYQLSSGEILYNLGNKLFLFPDSIPSNAEIPDIYITSAFVNNLSFNKVFPEADDIISVSRINLNHKQNNLRIEFTALNYLDSRNNKYRYFMNGIDKDTINTSANNRYAEYKQMQPGKYRFWVTGSNNDGVWNPTGRTIEIVITPPWYKSLLAIIMYGLIAISMVLIFIRIRLYQLKKEKMMLEYEVHLRTVELEEKNRHIEEMDRLKTRFFTEISHEIRTPLSLIIGPADNLIRESEGNEDERKFKWMEMIRRNGMRLLKLVNQLLDISKLDAGKMKVILSESDIMRCLKILAYEYLSTAESRRIVLSVNIPEDPYITFFDREKVEKIISNLLSNAFKFTPAGGTVSFNIEIIDSVDKISPATILIRVSDTGTGISKEHIDKIFDRFYSVEGQWEKEGGSTGVGLSLVKDFINLLHGKIEVSSEPGAGTTFSLSIPLGKEHFSKDEYTIVDFNEDEVSDRPHLTLSHHDSVERVSEVIEKNHQILLIEDNSDLRNFIHENLSSDYSICVADNGKNGLNVAFAIIPDLIITDILMPDLDGIEVCTRLKTDDRTSHIPVIMLTAKTTLEDKITGLKTGADDYLYKPFNIYELKIRISNLLVQREKLRLRFGLLTGFEQQDIHAESADEKFMRKIAFTINENMGDFEFDVGALQEKIGMSRVHLYRKLKAITGLSPSMIIRTFRMKKAAMFINQKAGSLLEIALMVGFSNPSYFAKCFREYYGVSPRDYTNQHSEKPETDNSSHRLNSVN
ncbi:MAG TPA: hypothetical protein DDY34_11205 [Bacteroidales bacterium]|nr:MAG: hypothetical protein A2X06_01465 [Bacteroidetes bacterium GWC2_40_22]HAM08917.1 hypothetical protein [Bacteroidales bacterium]HBH84363.1 hypothetical protein [Bacteroidales bacterium]HBQ83474.1 hypothetical protein [Bacteroidales bacterium]HCU19290.1 hypothetical protein [Bacteroidales bacterium]